MKKFISFFALSILLTSCSKETTTIVSNANGNDTVEVKNQFVVDSIRVFDSLKISKTLSVQFEKQLLVFPTITDKVLLDSIYSPTFTETKNYDKNSLLSALDKDKKKFFEENKEMSKDFTPDFEQTWDELSYMKIFSHNGDLLTLQYFGDGFSGGAHGYHYENYKVFDLKDKKVVSLNDIFINPNDKIWDSILSSHFNEKEQKEMLLVDKIPLNSNYYFDQNKITFVYNQYEITAYAAGVVFITINFNEIKDKLKPDFIKKYNIK